MFRPLILFLLALWIILWFPPVALAAVFKKKALRGKMIRFFSRGVLLLVGVKVTTVGEVSGARPLLLVSNHLSYLDIPILASAVDCRFVPKKEIGGWPVLGTICKITDAVCVDRSRGKIGEGNEAIAAKLAESEVVALFPEATTGDGRHLLPFKPAFFEAAADAKVQPVAIRYRKIRGLPIDFGQWPLIAWYGDMELLPHLWHLLSIGKIEAELLFLPVIGGKGEDRKMLASQAHDQIEAALLAEN